MAASWRLAVAEAQANRKESFPLDGRVLDASGVLENLDFHCLNVRISRLSELDLALGIQRDEGWMQEARGCRPQAGGWPQNKRRTLPE